MPYIEAPDRALILAGHPPQSCGELNFLLTMLGIKHTGRQTELVARWQEAARRYVATKGLSYQTVNDVMGAFVGAGYEFVRRLDRPDSDLVARGLKTLLNVAAEDFYTTVAGPYEDGKIVANGDLPYATL